MGSNQKTVTALLFAFCIPLILLYACGSDSEKGSIAFSIVWQAPPTMQNTSRTIQAESVDCEDVGVATVTFDIYDENGSYLAGGGPWPCEKHQGTVDGVPVGSNRKLVILGKDSDGNILYRGEITGIEVKEGQENNVGTIVLNPTDTTPPTGSISIDLGSSFSDGAEDGTGNWEVDSEWSASTADAYTGSQSFVIAPTSYYYGQDFNLTLASSIDLSSVPSDTATLTYYYKYNYNWYDAGYVEISTDGGSTWTTLNTYDSDQTTWTQGSIDLSSYVGNSEVKIRFRYYAYYGWDTYWYVDDILLEYTSTDTAYTNGDVILSLSCTDTNSGCTEMMISEDEDFTDSSWEDYTTSKSYTLSSGDGEKSVYVKFKDAAGNESDVESDSISLDQTPPTASTITINDGDEYTNSTSVNITTLEGSDATSGIGYYYLSENDTLPSDPTWVEVTDPASDDFSLTTATYTLSSGDGSKTIYAWFKDQAGNISDADDETTENEGISDSITLDTTPPDYLFSDDAEDDLGNWVADSEWSASTADAYTGSQSFRIAPFDYYYGQDFNLTLASSIDLSSISNATLTYYYKYNYYYYDAGYVEISTDGGDTWTTLKTYNSDQTEWTQETIDLGDYIGNSDVKIRFRYYAYYGYDTYWYVDDIIVLIGVGGSVSINGGDTYTNSHSVTLTISSSDSGSGLDQMIISEDADFTDATWEDYDTSKSFTLSSGDEEKTIYAWFKDQAGNESTAPASDSIILDTVAPTGSISIDLGSSFSDDAEDGTGNWDADSEWSASTADAYTGSQSFVIAPTSYYYGQDFNLTLASSIDLSSVPSDTATLTYYYKYNYNWYDAGYVEISTDGGSTWTTLNTYDSDQTTWTQGSIDLSSYVGNSEVKIRFRYYAYYGWDTYWYVDDILLEYTSTDTAYTNGDVILSLSCTDTNSGCTEMMISEDEDFTDSSWEDYTTSKSYTLSSGDGEKSVYVKFKDAAGNESDVESDSISLDQTPPTASTITINDGDEYTNSTSVNITTLEGSDATSGIGYYYLSENDTLPSDPTWVEVTDPASDDFSLTTATYTLSSGDGSKTIYAWFKDQAGNISDADDETTENEGISDSITLDTTPPDYLFSDDAEDDLGNWVADSEWSASTADAYTGSQSFRIAPFDYYYGQDFNLTLASSIDLSSISNATLTYYYKYNYYYYDAGYVEISTDGGDTWTTLKTYNSDQTEWTQETIDLGDYIGNSDVKIRFRYYAYYGYDTYWYVDDIIVLIGVGGSVSINGGDTYTNSHSVTLTISSSDSGSGLDQMIISEDADFTDATWEDYDTSKSFTLSSGDEEKTIYAWFKDQAGNESTAPASDSIILDTVAPTGSISIDFGSGFSFSDDAEGGIDSWTADSPWGTTTSTYYSSTTSFADSPSGNYSNNTNVSLTLSTPLNFTGLENPTFTFWHKYSTESCCDRSYVEISTDGGSSWTELASYAGTLNDWTQVSIDLSSYSGESSVLIRFRLRSDGSITYDGWYIDDIVISSESGGLISNPTYTNTTSVTLTLTCSDSSSGCNELMASEDADFTGASWEDYATSKSFELPSGDEEKTVYMKFKDAAGNESGVESDSITLDQTLPTASTITIENGDAYTNSTSVDITTLSGSDATSCIGHYYLSEAATLPSNPTWEEVTDPASGDFSLTTATFTLSSGDEEKTIYAWFKDQAGNISDADSETEDNEGISDSITLDTTSPNEIISDGAESGTGNWTLDSNWSATTTFANTGSKSFGIAPTSYLYAYYNLTSKTLDLSSASSATLTFYQKYNDYSSSAAYVQITTDGGSSWTTLATYNTDETSWTQKTIDLSSYTGTGKTNVKVRFRYYAYGGTSSYWYVDDIKITFDGGGSVSINSGASYTNSTSVTLTISASDAGSSVSQMKVSESSSFSGASWETYTTSPSFILSSGDGEKTVYVKFKDAAGNESTSIASDSIILDEAAPTGSISVDLGSSFSDGAEDGTGNWEADSEWSANASDAYTGSKSFGIKPTSNYYGSYFNLTLSNSIDLSLASSAELTYYHKIDVYSSSRNIGYVEISIDGGTNWTTLKTYDSDQTTWTQETIDLSSYIGNSDVKIRFRYYAYYDDYYYWYVDDVLLKSIESNPTYTNTTSVVLTLTCSDSGSGCAEMQFSDDNSTWTTAEAYASSKSYTLPTGDGSKTVYVKFKDSAGNWSAAISDSITLHQTGPNNPTSTSGYDSSGKTTSLTSGNWYNYSNPYFEWSGASASGLGIAGYYVYFGTNSTADPATSGTYQTGISYEVSATLSSGSTYYLLIKAKDNADNIANQTYQAFVYKYELTAPIIREGITWASPVTSYNSIDVSDYSSPAFADIDGDGDLDMFIGDYYGNIDYYENTGNSSSPSWASPVTSYNSIDVGYLSAPAFADIDGDGDVDMFIGNSNGYIYYYENTGTSTSPLWASPNTFYNSIDVGSWAAPAFTDIDGDGDLDMFIGDYYGNIDYYENTGNSSSPSWASPVTSYNSIDVGYLSAPAFADIDGDGDVDMFIGNSNGYIYYYENTGTPTSTSWASPVTYYNSIDVGSYSTPTFADIDGDDDLDMFVGESDGTINYYENTSPPISISINNAAYSTNSLSVTLSLSATDNIGVIGYYISNSSTKPTAGASGWISITSTTNYSITGINHSLSSGSDGERTVYAWFKDAAGNVSNTAMDSILYDATPPTNPTSTSGYNSFSKTTSLTSGNWYSYPNPYFEWSGASDSGSGIAGYYVYFGTDSAADPATSGTYQTDVYYDVTGTLSSGSTYYLLIKAKDSAGNTATSTYQAFMYKVYDITPPSLVFGDITWASLIAGYNSIDVGYYSAPAFADIDGDGDLDMFIGDSNGYIYYYENTGTSTSASWASPNTFYNLIDVGTDAAPVFADIDGDGDLDMFIGNSYGYIYYYENTGTSTSPSWASPNTFYNSIDVGYYSAPTFADIDADGDLDMYIGEDNGTINYYENTTSRLSILINDGAYSTNGLSVTLYLAATDEIGVVGYYISNSSTQPTADASGWTSVTSTTNFSVTGISHTLSSGSDGERTVYAWFKDAAGNVSRTTMDSIIYDTTAPTNPTSTSGYDSSSKTISLTSGYWYLYTNPYFEWSSALDSGSGIAGYYVYFGTDSAVDPATSGTYQTEAYYEVTDTLIPGVTYYLLIKAKDDAGNINTNIYEAFVFEFRGSMTIVGNVATAGYARGVYVSGSYAYVADEGSGLQVIDISDPQDPTIEGSVDTSGTAEDIYVSGSYAYVADGGSGLQVIDISDPANPTIEGSVDTPGTAYGVYVSGSYAYVADGGSGLQVIDISDPANPTIEGSYDTTGTAYEVIVTGSYAYVADGGSGLQVIDISDPTNPTIEGSVNTLDSARDVYISGSYAYVADWGSGLQVIDISDPANPTIEGSLDTPGYSRGVHIFESHAYLADYSNGIQVIDVITPSSPVISGTIDTPGTALDVYVSGSHVYVADYSEGLQVIHNNDSVEEMFESGDLNELAWITGGDGSWQITSNFAYNGSFAAVAPVSIEDSESSYLEITLDGLSGGNISFWFKVSSEGSYDDFDDILRFKIDGTEQGAWSGELDWTQAAFSVSSGTHTFRWEYTKDESGSSGSDTAWIDDIIFP